MRLRWTTFGMIASLLTFIAGCSSSQSQPNATPIITALSPSSITAGSQTFTLFISGQGFISGSSGTTTAYWNGSPRTGIVNTNTLQIAISVLPSDVANPGIAQITASNPPPGGGLSQNSATFLINPVQPSTPLITSITPTSASPAGASFTLTVNGTNFVAPTIPPGTCTLSPPVCAQFAGSTVQLNTSPQTTTFVNTGQLTAAIDASSIATAGCNTVTVYTPNGVGGFTFSPSVSFAVSKSGVPLICAISPATAVQNGPAFTMNLIGAGFTGSSTVQFDGNMEQTTFIDASNLQAQITASDLTKVGTFPVTVANSGAGSSTSIPVNFTVTEAPPPAMARFPQVVSVNASGGAADGPSEAPAMSADGRYVAFYSEAKNLLAGGAGGNVFVRDTCAGAAAACSPVTKAVDVTADGSPANGKTGRQVAISGDGRIVAFMSRATNLAASGSQPTSGFWSVYARDLCVGANVPSGCAPHTEVVSAALNGEPANGPSSSPSVSGDGRFVAFVSSATNISSDAVLARPQVFVRDTCAGPTATKSCVQQTTAVAMDDEDRGKSTQSGRPAISADGRYVSFEAWTVPATAQSAGSSSASSSAAIVLADTCLGSSAAAGCSPSARRVSYSTDGSPLAGVNLAPSINVDARFVVFESQPAGSNGNLPVASKVFLRDTCLGNSAPDGCMPSTSLIAAGANGVDKNQAFSPSISSSGRYISFVEGRSVFATATASTTEGALVVRDTCFNAVVRCTPRAYAFSAATASGMTSASKTTAIEAVGTAAKIPSVSVDQYSAAPISADGRYAAFYSPATAAAQPASGVGDVYISVALF